MVQFAKLKALVVDDNPHIRELMRNLLMSVQMEVRDAGDGVSALEILGYWKPDIIFVDYEMTPMDGAALTRRIRGNDAWGGKRVPVLMLTGHADKQHVVMARDAGVDGLISKPISVGAIFSRMTSVLEAKAGKTSKT